FGETFSPEARDLPALEARPAAPDIGAPEVRAPDIGAPDVRAPGIDTGPFGFEAPAGPGWNWATANTVFGGVALVGGTALDISNGVSIGNQFGYDSSQFASWAFKSVPTEVGTWGPAAYGFSTALNEGASLFDATSIGIGFAGRFFGPAAVLGSFGQIGYGLYQGSGSFRPNTQPPFHTNTLPL